MMKILRIYTLVLLFAGYANGQPFHSEKIFQFPHYDSINVMWGDLDGNSLLDIVAFAKQGAKTVVFTLLQMDSVTFQIVGLPIDEAAHLNFKLKDFNHDGKLDIIFMSNASETKLFIALNMGNLSFDFQEYIFPGDEFLVNDIDHDGFEDIIGSLNHEYDNKGIFMFRNDSLVYQSENMENVHLSNDHYYIENEILYTVIKKASDIYELEELTFGSDSLHLKARLNLPQTNSVTYGDMNHDGKTDLILQSDDQLLIIYHSEDQPNVDTLISGITNKLDIFIGDFDLDGKADILTTSTDEAPGQLIFYKNDGSGKFPADSSFFKLNHGFANIPADINDDGDLDLLSLIYENDSISFYVQLNQTTILNRGPNPVSINPPYSVYGKTFFSWQKTGDDHTDTLAISYEIFIQNNTSGNYHTIPGYAMDTISRAGFRAIVGHGYQWFDNQYTAKSLESGRYYWGVAGIDNAYYASADIRRCAGEGFCSDYYTPVNCFDLIVEDTVICFNTELIIDLGRGADSIHWYSVKRGFLGNYSILSYRAHEPDTIYAIHYPEVPCGVESDLCVFNYTLAIDVLMNNEVLVNEVVICPESDNLISVDSKWDSVRWWYQDEIVAAGFQISLDSVPEIPIVVEAFDSLNCPVYDTLKVTEAERSFDPASIGNTIKACKGQVTEIDIFSGVETSNLTISWMPGEVFNNSDSPNPTGILSDQIYVWAVITEADCYTDTITFNVETLALPELTTGGDREIFRGEKTFLEAFGAAKYSWNPQTGLESPNSQNTWASPEFTTNYTVTGSDEFGCIAEASLSVFVKNSVFIPDLFSPNGDGHNDLLHVYGEDIIELSFRVFSEQGSFLIELDESSNARGWDGEISGYDLPSGTYFWTVSGLFADGQSISYLGRNKGTIRLVR